MRRLVALLLLTSAAGPATAAALPATPRVWGVHQNHREPSASVVKAMLLADYLRRHRHLSALARASRGGWCAVTR